MTSCSNCGRVFGMQYSCMQHQHDKHHMYPKHQGTFPCSMCNKKFSWEVSLVQHQHDVHGSCKLRHVAGWNNTASHTSSHQSQSWERSTFEPSVTLSSLTSSLTKYYREKVNVHPNDRKESKAKAYDIIDRLMDEIRRKDGGNIYSPQCWVAGSTSTGTKVNVADEFDFHIPLNIKEFQLREVAKAFSFSIFQFSDFSIF